MPLVPDSGQEASAAKTARESSSDQCSRQSNSKAIFGPG